VFYLLCSVSQSFNKCSCWAISSHLVHSTNTSHAILFQLTFDPTLPETHVWAWILHCYPNRCVAENWCYHWHGVKTGTWPIGMAKVRMSWHPCPRHGWVECGSIISDMLKSYVHEWHQSILLSGWRALLRRERESERARERCTEDGATHPVILLYCCALSIIILKNSFCALCSHLVYSTNTHHAILFYLILIKTGLKLFSCYEDCTAIHIARRVVENV
jgi:hypothetical protein